MLVFENLRLGDVNRAREVFKCSSGKVLNVGLALHHLGGPNLTLALIGGAEGENIDKEFISLGVNHRWLWSPKSTRTCITIIDRTSGTTTELVENAAPVDAARLDQFVEAYREAATQAQVVVLSGSLPAGTPKSFYRDLIGATRAKIVLDASGQEMLEALALKPFCVKPNREELGKTLGRKLKTDEDLRSAIAEVCELGAEWVIVSQGSKPLWAGCRGRIRVFHPAKITAVNPIGSGDCLAAGVAWAVRNGTEMIEAIRFGMAAAAENAAIMLPGRLDLERVRSRASEITCSDL
jgi:1-phosphofructokinase family hexose kinase